MLRIPGAAIAVASMISLLACGTQDRARMIDIGAGRKLYLNCSGKVEAPTVVMDAGSGETSDTWVEVQRPVSRFAHVCSFDRADSGKSSPAGHPQTIDEELNDMGALLSAAKLPRPYILVGHSSGGLRVRRYQARDPRNVAGMVLVDASHEEQVWRFMEAIPGSVYGIRTDAASLAQVGMMPPNQRLAWHTDVPLIVIAHGGHMRLTGPMQQHAELSESMMRKLQEDLASRSPRAELRIAPHSGHNIQTDEPQIVVQAIRDMLDRVRGSSSAGKSKGYLFQRPRQSRGG